MSSNDPTTDSAACSPALGMTIVEVSPVQHAIVANGANVSDYVVLQLAIKSGARDIAMLLLQSDGYSVNDPSSTELWNGSSHLPLSTPLHLAVDQRDEEMAKMLLLRGASLGAKDYETGKTPVHLAVEQKNLEMLALLLSELHSADHGNPRLWVVNRTDNEEKTILHRLVDSIQDLENAYVDDEFARQLTVLVSKGATVDASSEHGERALRLVARHVGKNHSRIIEELVLHVAESKETWLRLCLQRALRFDSGVNDVLLSYLEPQGHLGYYYSCKERSFETVRMLVGKGAEVNAYNKNGATTMHLAAENGDYEILQFLISQATDVKACDVEANTVLHALLGSPKATADKEKVHLKIAETLLEAGVSVDAKNKSGVTHLHRACEIFRADVCRLLMQRGSDPRARDDGGNNVLHFLSSDMEENDPSGTDKKDAAREKEAMIGLLLSQGCGANDENESGRTALHCAVVFGAIDTAKVLIASGGADVNRAETSGERCTPLHLAATHMHLELLEFLLRCGADANARNSNGSPVLHSAVSHSFKSCLQMQSVRAVRLLLEHGADLELTDDLNRVALHRAVEFCNQPGLEELLDQGASIHVDFAPIREAVRDNLVNDYLLLELLLHALRLKAAGLPLREEDARFLRESIVDERSYGGDEAHFEALVDSVGLETELQEMRGIALDLRTTLYDLLRTTSAHELSAYADNAVLGEILASLQRFPRYGYVIRARARAAKRQANKGVRPSPASECGFNVSVDTDF